MGRTTSPERRTMMGRPRRHRRSTPQRPAHKVPLGRALLCHAEPPDNARAVVPKQTCGLVWKHILPASLTSLSKWSTFTAKCVVVAMRRCAARDTAFHFHCNPRRTVHALNQHERVIYKVSWSSVG